ncbi:MAG: hypothetical protein AB1758_21085, partial [Candidatus Eremiobacterota bacterium]
MQLTVPRQGDTYLVHPIHGNADFDQILKVDCPQSGLTDAELAAGVPVTVPGRANTVQDRLQPGPDPVRARVTEQRREVSLAIERELVLPGRAPLHRRPCSIALRFHIRADVPVYPWFDVESYPGGDARRARARYVGAVGARQRGIILLISLILAVVSLM